MPTDLPPAALTYLPTLIAEVQTHFPSAPVDMFAGQVEQETCPSLKSWKCWNPKTELKTSMEYGFGLGQLTVTARFNNFESARKLHPSLASWRWEERYDPVRQLRTMVLMDRGAFRALPATVATDARYAMSLSAYNGGLGGLLNDRRLCATVQGCDPNQWFGHVERTSYKAKTSVGEYSKSFYQINREYVRNVLQVRAPRYVQAIAALKHAPQRPTGPATGPQGPSTLLINTSTAPTPKDRL